MDSGMFGLGERLERLYGTTGRLPAAERLHAGANMVGYHASSPYQKWKPPSGDSWAKESKAPKRTKSPRRGRPLTMEEIEERKSPKGGFPRKLVTSWGVPWPLVSGWKKRLIRGEYD